MGQYQEDPSHLVRPHKSGWLACSSMSQEETLAPTVFCHWQRSGAFRPGVWGSVRFSSGGVLELPEGPSGGLRQVLPGPLFPGLRNGRGREGEGELVASGNPANADIMMLP